MTQPTHTHREHGGKYAFIGELNGGNIYNSEMLVIYHDVDKNITSHAVESDWQQNWKAIERNDCPVCLGSGHDQIKGNKDKPCGGCYGLGKVMQSGERPTDLWEIATVATGIIERQREKIAQLSDITENPAIKSLLDQQRQQAMDDSMARQEQHWRDGQGAGPGGQRFTGD